MNNLLAIDYLTVNDHSYLNLTEDECYFLGTYTSNEGFNSSNSNNSLILNLKKKPSTSALPGYHYKQKAINQIASYINNIFDDQALSQITFIPIPPSKIPGHVDYDDRMLRVLQKAFDKRGADIRELVTQVNSRECSHESEIRPSISDLENNLQINTSLEKSLKNTIILFDDIITSGTHFKAIKNVLSERYPDKKIIGVFVCRRVFD